VPALLLDEPLKTFDPKYASDLMARLHHISRPGQGMRSVVIVVHDINATAGWADRIARKDGRLLAEVRGSDV
jgi:iron complex transport system ATP-binding protein